MNIKLISIRGSVMIKLVLTVSIIICYSGLFSQNPGCWNIFRGNQSLAGNTLSKVPATPKLLWTFATGDDIKGSPVVCNGKIVIGSTDGYIYCLNGSGKLIWKFNTENTVESPALILENVVFAGNMDGTIYALDLATGAKKWMYKTEGQIVGSPNWWKNGAVTCILAGSYDYNLHCIDAASGKPLWKYESDNYINGAPSCNNGKALFGGCDGFLHVVDVKTGKADKKIELGTYVAGSVAVDAVTAWVGNYDGGFMEVDLPTGKIVWTWSDENTNLPFIASPAISGSKVVTANHNKMVYCFEKKTGKLLWSYNSGNRVEASPVIAGDKVIVANMRGDLAMLNLSDGKPVWTYESGGSIVGNPAVADGNIIVGNTDGNIYCFGRKDK